MLLRSLICTMLLSCSLQALDDSSGKPVFKASVIFGRGEAEIPVTVITDKDGSFTITGLTQGAYLVAAVAKGFLPKLYGAPIQQTRGRRWRPNRMGHCCRLART